MKLKCAISDDFIEVDDQFPRDYREIEITFNGSDDTYVMLSEKSVENLYWHLAKVLGYLDDVPVGD